MIFSTPSTWLFTVLHLLMALARADHEKRQLGTPTSGSGGSTNTGGGSGSSPSSSAPSSQPSTQATSSSPPPSSSAPSQVRSSPSVQVSSPASQPSDVSNPLPISGQQTSAPRTTMASQTPDSPSVAPSSFSAPPTSQNPTSETSVPQVSSQAPSTVGGSSQPISTAAPGSSVGNTQAGSSAPQTSGPSVVSSGAVSSVTGGSSVLASGLGTTSENGQLVFRTTDAQGHTLTYSGSAASSAISAPVTETTPLVASSTHQLTSTVVLTTDGRELTSVATTQAVDVSTTGFATHTSTPQLNAGESGSGSNGMSPATKRVVGGVVGGIGGAIVIGALALVAWRIWGRKRSSPEEDTLVAGSPYHSGGPTLATDKRSSHGGSTVYSNGLERYNGGQQNVNTASNF